jgi:hypothetical protein
VGDHNVVANFDGIHGTILAASGIGDNGRDTLRIAEDVVKRFG